MQVAPEMIDKRPTPGRKNHTRRTIREMQIHVAWLHKVRMAIGKHEKQEPGLTEARGSSIPMWKREWLSLCEKPRVPQKIKIDPCDSLSLLRTGRRRIESRGSNGCE